MMRFMLSIAGVSTWRISFSSTLRSRTCLMEASSTSARWSNCPSSSPRWCRSREGRFRSRSTWTWQTRSGYALLAWFYSPSLSCRIVQNYQDLWKHVQLINASGKWSFNVYQDMDMINNIVMQLSLLTILAGYPLREKSSVKLRSLFLIDVGPVIIVAAACRLTGWSPAETLFRYVAVLFTLYSIYTPQRPLPWS